MKKSKTISAVVFSTAILFSSAHAEEISDLQDQVKSSQENKEKLQSQLKDVQADISVTNKKLGEATEAVNKTNDQISSTQALIDQTTKKIADTTENIRVTTIELQEKKDALARNLRKMYAKGDVTMMEYLFRSDDISQFIDRFSMIKKVAAANRTLYQEVREKQEELTKQKALLETQKTTQEESKNKLVDLQKTQESQKKEQMNLLKQLVEKQESVENDIDDQDKAIDSLNGEIAKAIQKREEEKKRLAAEAAAKAEAERQRQASIATQQQQQKQQTSSTNTTDSTNTVAKTPSTPSTPPSTNTSSGVSRYGFQRPMASGTYFISSSYGWRTHPITGAKKLHNGTDFAAPLGTPMYAIGDGYVLFAGPATGYGHWIVIEHDNGMYSIYGHMYANQLYVKPGQTVKRGQKIAAIGTDGGSTGPHLHMSLSDSFSGGTFHYVDPMDYLP